MAQAGYTPIQLYYSTTASAAPSSGNLANGELAINITDGKLYYKDNGGVVQVLASKAGASGDVVGPASATDNALVRFDATTGKLVQNSVGVLDDSGNLTGIAALTTSGALTLNGGTANGVAYLDGSKVLTTGSALTFDGTNLGIGVTPSAWGTYRAMQIGSAGVSLMGGSAGVASFASVGNNFYFDGSSFRYVVSAPAGRQNFANGAIEWFTAPSGTAGNAISFTQAMTLDASGNLGVGLTNPSAYGSSVRLQLYKTSFPELCFADDATPSASAAPRISGGNAEMRFSTNGSERARIDSSGNLLVGKTSSSLTNNGFQANASGMEATANADAGKFYVKTTNGGAGVILTYSNVGSTAALVGAGFANGTFGAVSDATKKKNVETARDYLQDIMSLRVVKYNWNTDEDGAPRELGWIAQEVEQVFPGMVVDMKGSKILKKEIFLPMLMKCIQEQQAIINAQSAALEQLKADVAALKGAA